MSKKITRRDFLKLGTAGIATSVLAGCQNPRRWVVIEPYLKPPEEQLAGVATWYASTCRQCPAGCGIIVRIMNGRALKIEGNPQHPLNQGKLCGRGQAGLQVLYNPDRLPGPVKQNQRGTRQYANISWNEGINQLFTKIQNAGDKAAVWLGSTTSSHPDMPSMTSSPANANRQTITKPYATGMKRRRFVLATTPPNASTMTRETTEVSAKSQRRSSMPRDTPIASRTGRRK